MITRTFPTYAAYTTKQIEKTSNPVVIAGLKERNLTRISRFQEYFQNCGIRGLLAPIPENNFLCIGARLGCEVMALRNIGYTKSIGVDLFPLDSIVEKGDFHNLQYHDNAFHGVYSNSLDHAHDLSRMLAEAERVLAPGGIAILHAGINMGMGEYETLIVESPEEITLRMPNCDVIKSQAVEFPMDNYGGLDYELFLRKRS